MMKLLIISKKTFKNVEVEERKTNDGFPNPYDENEEGDWVEIFLNDFDTVSSIAYDPNKKLFQLVVDSCWVIYDGKTIDFDEECAEGYDATPENLKLYNKRSVNKICKAWENG